MFFDAMESLSIPQNHYQNDSMRSPVTDLDYQTILMDQLSGNIKSEFAADGVAPPGLSGETGIAAVESSLALLPQNENADNDASSYVFADSGMEHAASSNSPESYVAGDSATDMSYSLSSGTYQIGMGTNGSREPAFLSLGGEVNYGLNLPDHPSPYSAMSESALSDHLYMQFHPSFQHHHAEIYASPSPSPGNPLSPAASEPIPHRERAYAAATQKRSHSANCASSRYRGESRVTKPPKKNKKTQKIRPKIPKLTQPLSELTKDYIDKPLKDIDALVNRSIEVRRQEVKEANRISRPMNAFMLYRSAYAERCKLWCTQNNHQVVSTMCGQSWRLEPEHIKEKFNEYSRIERMNHQKAHPGYKFSPSKTQGSKKKKSSKKEDHNEVIDFEDLDGWGAEGVEGGSGGGNGGPDSERRGSSGPMKKKTSTRAKKHSKVTAELTLPMSRDFGDLTMPTRSDGASKSSFEANNPGKTPPQSIADSGNMTGTYLQTTIETAPAGNGGGHIENVTIKRTQGPTRLSVSIQTPLMAQEHPSFDAAAQFQYEQSAMDGMGMEQVLFNYPSVSESSSNNDMQMYLHSPHHDQAISEMVKMVSGPGTPQPAFQFHAGGYPFHNFGMSVPDINCIRAGTVIQGAAGQGWDVNPDNATQQFVSGASAAVAFGEWCVHD